MAVSATITLGYVHLPFFKANLKISHRENIGNFTLYTFEGRKSVSFADQPPVKSVDLAMLKINEGAVTPGRAKKARSISHEAAAAYAALQKKGIRVPYLYFTTVDGWMFLEKMKAPVDPNAWKETLVIEDLDRTQKSILDFAKKVLTKSAKNHEAGKQELVGDFLPHNVSLTHDDKPCVTTFTKQKRDSFNLFAQIDAWANKNRIVFDYLIGGFPEAKKEKMIQCWEKNILR